MNICDRKKHNHFLKAIPMRKLKLQVQMTVDGFVAGPDGQLVQPLMKMEKYSINTCRYRSASTLNRFDQLAEGFLGG